MIGIYERSLCQSYASAYRAGIKIGEAETREDALKQVEAMTEDSYQCFAVDDDGTCIDLTGTFRRVPQRRVGRAVPRGSERRRRYQDGLEEVPQQGGSGGGRKPVPVLLDRGQTGGVAR